MTNREQIAYWRKWDAFQRSRERMWINPINKAIQEQYKQFLEYYKQGYSPTLSTFNIREEPLNNVLQQLYVNVGLSWANMTRLDLQTKERRPMGFNEEMTALILQYFQTDLLNDVSNMTATTRKEILDAIESAINNGFGFDDIVKMLENAQLTKIRARLIARTEIVTAANTAAEIQAVKSGLKLRGIWISARDNRTRLDHIEVNGKTTQMGEPFIVGGFPMMHPGDRGQNGNRTPAKQICNCRCTKAFIKVK
jgi:hypothetical protein